MIVSMSTVSSSAASPSGVTMTPRSVLARKPRLTSACVVVAHSTRALGALTSGNVCVAYAPRTVVSAMESGATMQTVSIIGRWYVDARRQATSAQTAPEVATSASGFAADRCSGIAARDDSKIGLERHP